MLVELNSKAGNLCSHAKDGSIRCPLIVRSTSEDVVTGQIVQALKLIDPRHWLSDLLNAALGAERFPRQVYRHLKITPWVGKPPFPRELLKWDEGSTEVDVQITWENPPTTIFIEAKYGSKLAASTSNNNGQHGFPGDQLIRNIRVGLKDCGYYQESKLFDSQPRDFAVIVLAPERGQPLVRAYQDEATLRKAIPHSDKIEAFPKGPFVGELGYADIIRTLSLRRRSRLAAARRVGTPLGGVYWWIPVPNEDKTAIAGWKLQTFYDAADQETKLHYFEWPMVVRFLQSAWQKDLSPAEDAYRSIPRGRIDLTKGAGTRLIPTLFHDGDTPAGHTLKEIEHAFNLTNSARSLADEVLTV